VVPGLLKVVLLVGLVVGAAVEVGRPAMARLELHDVAANAANVAEEDLADRGPKASHEVAREVAQSSDAKLVAFEVEPGGRVSVRVARHVDPVVLDELDRVKGWYDVEMAATSDGIPGS
jgi:hypothetical protein